MAYSYDFKDNVVYGADHINAIRASILTKGVIEETDASCKVILSDGSLKIQQGQAVFADGCRIEIDADGVEREFVSGQTNYVYLYNNILAGVCEVIVSAVLPEGDYVMLAEIDAEGVIVDKREFAELKTADTQRYIETFTANVSISDDPSSEYAVATVSLPKSNCSMVEFYMYYCTDYYNVKVFPKENNYVILQSENGLVYSGETVNAYGLGKSHYLSFKISGNIMTITLESISQSSNDTRTMELKGFCVR